MSSQTTTTPASRPNLQERGRRAEQREVNLHELADPRNPAPHGHPVNPCKTTHPPACRKHGKTGGERHRTAQDRRKPHRKPTPGRVATTVSECARLKNKYKTTSSQNIQRENNTTTLDTHSAASIHPSSLRYAIQLASCLTICETLRLPTLAAPFTAIA